MNGVLLLVLIAKCTWAAGTDDLAIEVPSADLGPTYSVIDTKNESNPAHNPDICRIYNDVKQDWSDHTYVCERATSLYNLFREKEHENRKVRLAVSVRHVDGELKLNPPSSVILVSLSLLSANVTSIKYDTTEDKNPLGSLVRLDLRDNPELESSWLKGSLPSLQELDLQGTHVSKEDLQSMLGQLPVLRHLSIASTGLSDLPESFFDNNTELTKLNLASNNFGKITLKERVIRKLTSLNISNCGLTEILVKPTLGMSSNVQRLRTLDVSANSLTWLPTRLLKAVHKNSFIRITGNKWACNRCQLFYLWKSAKSVSHVDGLEELSCFNPEILRKCTWDECPEDCSCAPDTKTVNCTGRGLDSVPLVGPADTRTLLLDNNLLKNIEGLSSASWCNLESLSLNNISVTNIVPNDQWGNCRCISHEIYHGQHNDCYPQNLRDLHLNNNNIASFTAFDCRILYPIKTLSLVNNKITRPEPHLCGSLRNLETLNLAHNNVTALRAEDLEQYPNLRELNLTHNSVGNGSLNVRPLPFLSQPKAPDSIVLILDNNPGLCEYFSRSHLEIPESIKVKIENCSDHTSGKFQYKTEATTTERQQTADESNTLQTIDQTDDGSNSINATNTGLVTFFTVFIIVVAVLALATEYIKPNGCSAASRRQRRLETQMCTYSVYVVHSPRDREMVRTNVIIPLIQRGYNVAWPEGTFTPGDWILENIDRTIRKSEKMLVVATDNLASSQSCLMEIRRGRHEELERNGSFKIMALVTESLPRELPQDLFDIVALRTSVPYSNRDYIEKICSFLSRPRPSMLPAPVQEVNRNSIAAHFHRFEEMRRKESGNSGNRCISDIVHARISNSGVHIDFCIAKDSKLSNSSISTEEYAKMRSKYQSSPKLGRLTPGQMDSLEYVLIKQETEAKGNDASVQDHFTVSVPDEPETSQDQPTVSISVGAGSLLDRVRFSIVNRSCRF